MSSIFTEEKGHLFKSKHMNPCRRDACLPTAVTIDTVKQPTVSNMYWARFIWHRSFRSIDSETQFQFWGLESVCCIFFPWQMAIPIRRIQASHINAVRVDTFLQRWIIYKWIYKLIPSTIPNPHLTPSTAESLQKSDGGHALWPIVRARNARSRLYFPDFIRHRVQDQIHQPCGR